MTEQKELVDTETEFFIRDKNNLEDYLYEIESSYLKKEAANNFDQLDMVFVTGDTNVRPWSPSLRKILTLVRMCLRVKKHFYASSWAMQALVFLSASNLEKNIDIINGLGDGGKLSEIQTASAQLKSVKPSDYFLDNTTGDLYGFNYETSEWIPKGNCGLHCRRSAQEFQSLGKYIVKAPIYKANTDHKSKYKLFKSRKYEETCRIKKMHMHHWLFEGLDDEFIVPLKNSWDIHTFSFINPEKHFNCLADSERGPIIIEMENIVGVLFSTNTKYSNTIQPLRNFIWNTLKTIKSLQGKTSVSISSYLYSQKESTIEETLRKQKEKSKRQALVLLNKRAQQMGFHQVDADLGYTKSDVFLHVGFSAKKSHVPQYVYNNMVNDQKLKIKEGNIKMLTNDPNIGNHIKLLESPELEQPEITTQYNSLFKNQNIDSSKPQTSQETRSSRRLSRKNSVAPIKKIEQQQLYTSGGIRRTLHPSLSPELLDFSKLWVPGNLSKPDDISKKGSSLHTPQGGSSVLTTGSSHRRYQQDSSNILTKSKTHRGKDFGEFVNENIMKFESSDFVQQKSLFMETPYITSEDIYKKDIKERQSKIIGERDFRVGAALIDLNSIYKSQSDFNSGCPPSSYFRHQFREQHKDKWLSQGNFKLI